MKSKWIWIAMLMTGSFGMGFVAHRYLNTTPESNGDFKRVTGIGGIFFKCKDPKMIRAWYQEHLGINTNPYGAVFEWRQGADSTQKGFTQWSPFGEKTQYFCAVYQGVHDQLPCSGFGKISCCLKSGGSDHHRYHGGI